MSLTVRELLASPSLGLELLVEGDLDRRIRWVHATEQPDPTPYLRGGEVVLTDGVALRGGTPAADYAARLRAADVVALGHGLIEGEPPPRRGLVEACRSEGLTLFTVPVGVPYLAISEVFVASREAPLLESVRRGDRLLRAAAEGAGLAATVSVLADELGRAVRVHDRAGRVLAESDARAGAPAPDDRPAGASWRLPLLAGGGREGVLEVAGEGEPAADEHAAIDQAVAVLTLELVHARALRETQRRLAAELFDLVDAGEIAAVEARLRGFGIAPDDGLVGVVCEPAERLPDLEDTVGAIAAAKPGRLVALARGDPGDLGARLEAALPGGVTIGVGGVAHGAAALRTTLAEAAHACSVARLRRDTRRSATHAEVGSHRLLLALLEPSVTASLSRAVLGPLLDYDARRNTELVATLRAFLAANGHWQATARTLHIHVNTLRQRLARVEELTGRSLDSMEDRVDLFLALADDRH